MSARTEQIPPILVIWDHSFNHWILHQFDQSFVENAPGNRKNGSWFKTFNRVQSPIITTVTTLTAFTAVCALIFFVGLLRTSNGRKKTFTAQSSGEAQSELFWRSWAQAEVALWRASFIDVHSFIDWLADWLIDWLIDWFIHSLIHWLIR